MNDFTIRLAEKKDINDVARLYSSLIGSEGCVWNEYYPTAEDVASDVERGSLYVICDGDGGIAGAAAAEAEEEKLDCWSNDSVSPLELSRVGVASRFRGAGLAGRLVSYIEKDVAHKGCDSIRLLAHEKNKAAIRLYERHSYVPVGEAELYGNGRYICYEKKLSPTCGRSASEGVAALLEITAGLLEKSERVIIAVDGRAASGKTTFAANFAAEAERAALFRCNVFHIDDYFLRPEQRTAERLAEAGGNFDRERFYDEILSPLSRGETPSFRRFDCGSGTLCEPVTPSAEARVCLVEGSYSCHPDLWESYSYRVFMTVPPEVQLARLRARNESLLRDFTEKWIPLEERYFAAFDIAERCDMLIENKTVKRGAQL